MPTADAVFQTVIKNPAWKTKPSWYMVAKSDRIINPDLELMYAKRTKSVKVEIPGASHSVYESHPQEVSKLIIMASEHALEKREFINAICPIRLTLYISNTISAIIAF